MRTFLFFLLCLSTQCFASFNESATVELGKVTYNFSEGQMVCLSELDANQHTFILLKRLKENTEITFKKVYTHPDGLVVKLSLAVKLDTDLCASWTNVQEVDIVICPKEVAQTSFAGKIVYQKEDVTVMVSNH